MHFHDRGSLYKLITNPDLHFGDLYSAGRITIEGDLVAFLETVYLAMQRVSKSGLTAKLLNAWQKRPRPNSLSGSLDNIHHHYDLGNEFYETWLDNEAMQYTCAYYPTAEATLEEAQVAKMHHIAKKLQLKSGDTVIEAGCGWGGLARFFARNYGVKMRSYNISKEQLAYAREKAKREGLDGQIEYIEDDYRNASGECDVFVSVGMLEHVGANHYQELGSVVDRVLKPNGRGLIHSIGRNHPALMNAWIEKRIFPGAYPPSLKEMMDIFEPNGLSVLDVENIRLHYAQTLRHWLERFDNHEERIAERFDENFIRAWRLYLSGSIAAFTTGELQLFQVVFSREHNNEVPWTRAHLYE
jgi:cyclopropane-fatty-acyl-phospholipid synthase